MSVFVPSNHAFAMERAIRTFFAVKGVETIPCTQFSGRNEAHQQAPTTFRIHEASGLVERMVLPDLIRFPSFHALEVKTQGYSPWMNHGRDRTTGFSLRHYRHYRRYEQESGRDVEIAFAHLVENEIRGGTLTAIEPLRRPEINFPGKADVYWDFLALPRWPESLTDVLDVALRHGPMLGRDGYTATDHAEVIRYRDTVAIPNWERHSKERGPRAAA